jgi:cytochrome c-type biogenesis protein CcsB
MKRSLIQWIVILLISLVVPSRGIQALVLPPEEAREEKSGEGGGATPSLPPHFGEEVDVGPLRTLAVFHNGRVKIIDTLAREVIQGISGRPSLASPETGSGYDPVFTYFDLIFRHELYLHYPMVYVKNKEMRETLLQHLPEEDQKRWTNESRLAPHLFSDPAFQQSLTAMMGDAIKTQALNQVGYSLQTFLQVGGELLLIPPEEGSDRWVHIEHVPEKGAEPASGVDLWGDVGVGDSQTVSATYLALATAWRSGDAVRVNDLVGQLGSLLPSLREQSYPPRWKRTAELLYNRTARFTYAYVAYLLAFLSLVIGLAAGRRRLVRLGAVLLSAAFMLHTLGMITRIALSDRPWAIHNQFESFFMLSWFGVFLGLVLLFLKRQRLYGAAAAAVGAVTLLIMNTTPIPSSEIAPVAPILITSRILYVHVNIMIVSYALITLGFIISCFYLATYYLRGNVALAAAGVAGAGGLVNPTPSGTALQDLERAQRVILQMVFWLLIVGILLGAYWADHSWGRWWGWDPKETWALMTWIVYLAAVHLRFVVKRPALVTAWMSVLGFLMMLWNHWGVNLLLAGLHSYA